MPDDKLDMMAIANFFGCFGKVLRVDLHTEKMAATIKFEEVESAEKAAHFAIQQRQTLLGSPQVQLIYNIAGQAPRGGLPGSMLPMNKIPS